MYHVWKERNRRQISLPSRHLIHTIYKFPLISRFAETWTYPPSFVVMVLI
ncbi:unnamed protein product [Arabidopsis lyrata]|uniref:Predicted protein n=1 Tax=Arabidopsis lyrata subsp. lyrata TaxID=81972 RepID=D7MK66_ARALL|nr:predicted protein [Arabidopsis lyrata subsp. lyrata]CAH8277345.1 unnamed protein product [Arabidopsis lyrata]